MARDRVRAKRKAFRDRTVRQPLAHEPHYVDFALRQTPIVAIAFGHDSCPPAEFVNSSRQPDKCFMRTSRSKRPESLDSCHACGKRCCSVVHVPQGDLKENIWTPCGGGELNDM